MIIEIEEISVVVERKSIKNMYLKVVPPSGIVKVSAPKRMKQEQIEQFLRERLAWIRVHRERMQKASPEKAARYETGEQIRIFEAVCTLKVIPVDGRMKVERHGKEIWLYVKPGTGMDKREKLLREWYRKQLKERIAELIRKWEPVIGRNVKEWNVKSMKTRWGTCNPAAGRIWLSLMLAEYPPECLEYVVVHEMVHLLERGHNARFYAYMDRFLPDWIIIREKLRENS